MKRFLSMAGFILGCVGLIIAGVMIVFHLVREAWAGFTAILVVGLVLFFLGIVGLAKNPKRKP